MTTDVQLIALPSPVDEPTIDPQPFAALVSHLMDSYDLPWPVIAQIADIDPAVVYDLVMGQCTFLATEDADALLAVDDKRIRRLLTSSTRCAELQRNIWKLALAEVSIDHISRLLSLPTTVIRRLMSGESVVCTKMVHTRAAAALALITDQTPHDSTAAAA